MSPEDSAREEGSPPDAEAAAGKQGTPEAGGGGPGSEPGTGAGTEEERSRPELDQLAKYIAQRLDVGIAELDFSMFDPETRRIFLTRLGDKYAEEGRLGAAQEAYDMAGAPDRLVALGDKFMDMKWYPRAVEVYVMAGREMPAGKLLRAGEMCIAEGDVAAAAEAYQLAGRELSCEELLLAAGECMRRRGLEAARRAFAMAFRKSGNSQLAEFLRQFEGKRPT